METTVNILWLLVSAGLVFLMQPGFMCLESGLTRSKNSINVAVKNLADFGISVAFFWLFGYALMFGVSQGGWLGSTDFLTNLDSQPQKAAFFLFQVMFCSTTATIVSGAVAERMKFGAYLITTGLVSSTIYPFFGHWSWNQAGWLKQLGFVDFAGSTVVHSVGGWVGLAALLVIGSRTGRFLPEGRPLKIHGSNLQFSVLGAMLLWIGWLGFNGGSTLELNEQVPGIIVNTVLAGVAGMITAGIIGWQQHKIPEVEVLINGSLAGLVAITANCNVVNTGEAAIIGSIGAGVTMVVSYWLKRWRIDDAVDAIAVHGGAGVWGTLAVALFGKADLLATGLNKENQILVQLLGIFVCFIWSFGLSYLLLSSLKRFFPLRVSLQEEKVGLNISEHRAKTEVHDLFKVMDLQAETQDLSLRVPVEPFTEVGLIAQRYNQVMDALEEAINRTEALFKTATDAIITFSKLDLQIIMANPSAEVIFGYPLSNLVGMSMYQLLELPEDISLENLLGVGLHEIIGKQANDSTLPLEASLSEAKLASGGFYTGIFRDISDRKEAQQALAQANLEITTLNQRLQQENLRLSAEVDITRRLQTMILPNQEELRKIPELDIAGFMEPAHEVGGDYYDVIYHDGSFKIGIGDVTGHGLESGVLMLMVQTAVRTLLANGETDLKKYLEAINWTVYENVQRMSSDKNLTLCLLDYQAGILTLSGQHEEVILVRQNGEIERIDTIDLGFPLGLIEDVVEFLAETKVELGPGDGIILYTDGITEAENEDGLHYGIERLCQVIQQHWSKSVGEICSEVISHLKEYIGEQKIYDDITLVAIKRKGLEIIELP